MSASKRVAEYIRQRKNLTNASSLIHGCWTDSKAEMADLWLGDLEEILELAEMYEDLCD